MSSWMRRRSSVIGVSTAMSSPCLRSPPERIRADVRAGRSCIVRVPRARKGPTPLLRCALPPVPPPALRPPGSLTPSHPDPTDFRDGPRDECGVFGIQAPGADVARLTYFGLYALQHRGQESAGIAAAQRGHIMAMRDKGLVSQVFDEQKLRALQGDMAVGHVRYSTTGANSWENTQPVWRADRREVALAHNGNLVNAVELHAGLREEGVAFRSTSDSEIIAALLSTHEAPTIEDAVEDVLPRLEGAFSPVVMTADRVVAFRAPAGLRPLALGMLGDRYCVASETCAFDIIGARFLRDVQPGEVVSITEGGLQVRQAVPSERRALCVF